MARISKEYMKLLTAKQLREALHYDPQSGIFTWKIRRSNQRLGTVAGTDCNGYRKIRINGLAYFAHRLAWLYIHGQWPAEEVDHINLDKADNRIGNLRLASHSQNHANEKIRSRNKTGYKGVFFNNVHQRFHARITKNYKVIHLGLFDTPEDAHAAYCNAAREHFGEFARSE